MASPASKSAGYGVRLFFICMLGLLSADLACAQPYPFEDHRGGLWLAGCEAGSEGFYYFDGSRFIEPLKDQFPKVIVRGLAEDTDGGIWISSSNGIYRFHKGQIQKKFDGIALAGITQIAPDVFLATLAQSSTDPVHHAALVRISRLQGEWKADVIQEPVQQLQYRLDHPGHVLYGCIEGYCELSASEIVGWKPGFSRPFFIRNIL